MIRKQQDGFDIFECSKCGEQIDPNDDFCQICGHEFDSIQNQTELEDTAQEDETMCILIGANRSGEFTFTQLKIDMTPKMVLGLPSFQNQRLMSEADPYEFYVFKSKKYPFLTQGTQVNLKLENYKYFKTSNGFKIFYDKEHFSNYDINELKTYNFNV